MRSRCGVKAMVSSLHVLLRTELGACSIGAGDYDAMREMSQGPNHSTLVMIIARAFCLCTAVHGVGSHAGNRLADSQYHSLHLSTSIFPLFRYESRPCRPLLSSRLIEARHLPVALMAPFRLLGRSEGS